MDKFLRVGVGIFLIILADAAQAKDLADPQSGCQLTVPDDWSVKSSKDGSSYTSMAASADQTESISLFVTSISSSGPLNEDSEYVKGFLKSCQDHGATIIQRKHQTLNGMDFYVISVSTIPGSSVANMSAWLTVANGKVYQLGLGGKDTDPTKSTGLQAVLNSFSIPKN